MLRAQTDYSTQFFWFLVRNKHSLNVAVVRLRHGCDHPGRVLRSCEGGAANKTRRPNGEQSVAQSMTHFSKNMMTIHIVLFSF